MSDLEDSAATGKTLMPCGTKSARTRHDRHDHEECDVCWPTGRPNKALVAECGTPSGRIRHQREGTPVCSACADATREYNRNARRESDARRRAAEGLPPRQPKAVRAVSVGIRKVGAPTRVVPAYDPPSGYARARGTHCVHCLGRCKDYHMWDCKECKSTRSEVLQANNSAEQTRHFA